MAKQTPKTFLPGEVFFPLTFPLMGDLNFTKIRASPLMLPEAEKRAIHFWIINVHINNPRKVK